MNTPNLPSKPPRPRGAPPGNSNALRHGFYSKRFQKRELTDLEAASFQGLTEEIALLRLFVRRMVEKWDPSCDLFETAYLLRVLCFASSSIERMLKTQTLASRQIRRQIFDDSRDQAIEQVLKEFGIDENWPNEPPSTAYQPISFTHPTE